MVALLVTISLAVGLLRQDYPLDLRNWLPIATIENASL